MLAKTLEKQNLSKLESKKTRPQENAGVFIKQLPERAIPPNKDSLFKELREAQPT